MALIQLVQHPEYNSTLILRSDEISDSEIPEEFNHQVPRLDGIKSTRNIHRRLLPRRPGRDPPIEQHCTFYTADTDEDSIPISCLVLTPILSEGEQMPYYHPAVHHIAFRYLLNSEDHCSDGRLRIEAVPLPGAPDPKDINSRLYRTSLALLETLHRYCWGAVSNYKKRVHHDCLVSREEYQDLYLVMRERHKHLVNEWQEVTDPLKHVFEVRLCPYL